MRPSYSIRRVLFISCIPLSGLSSSIFEPPFKMIRCLLLVAESGILTSNLLLKLELGNVTFVVRRFVTVLKFVKLVVCQSVEGGWYKLCKFVTYNCMNLIISKHCSSFNFRFRNNVSFHKFSNNKILWLKWEHKLCIGKKLPKRTLLLFLSF